MATQQWVSLVVVAAVANLLVFTDSKTFHAELKGRDLRTAAEGFDVIYYAEGLSGTVTAVVDKLSLAMRIRRYLLKHNMSEWLEQRSKLHFSW